jgi:hypothetical protein
MIEVDRFENTRVYIVRACVFTVSARSQSRDRINTWKFTVPRPSSTPNVLRPGPPAGGLLLLAISAKRKNRTPGRRADGWEVPCRKHAPTSIANSCANCDCTLPS